MSDHVRVPGENRPVDRLLLEPTPRLPDLLDDVITLEEDEEATLEEETEALQRMISRGMWSLQGSMGRAMMNAIESGYCVLGPNSARDYWGSRIPARTDVVDGTFGSIGYANRLREERGDELITEEYLARVEG